PFTDVDEREGTSFGRSDEDIDSSVFELWPLHRFLVVSPPEDDAYTGPIGLRDKAKAVGFSRWQEDADRVWMHKRISHSERCQSNNGLFILRLATYHFLESILRRQM